MEIGSLKQTFREKTAQTLRQKQIGRMKLGQLFSLPESKFRKLIKELENTSLFKELRADLRTPFFYGKLDKESRNKR